MRVGLADAAKRYLWLLAGIALLGSVYLLPPDTSLKQVQKNGLLTACIPPSRPPLVTNEAERPGMEVELLQAIAREIGVELNLYRVTGMDRGFDPRSWGITRAQCSIIAGGVVDSTLTRSFLDVTPPFAETGLVALSRAPIETISGLRAAVPVTLQGVDRLALSGFLRSENVVTHLVRGDDQAVTAVLDGTADFAIVEAAEGRTAVMEHALQTVELPPRFASQPLVFGLWKGDLTLKRAITSALRHLSESGDVEKLIQKYSDA